MPSALRSSSFSFGQAAALHEEARGHPAREAAGGGRLAMAGLSELSQYRSPRSAACQHLLGQPLLSKLHEDRPLCLFSPHFQLSPGAGCVEGRGHIFLRWS